MKGFFTKENPVQDKAFLISTQNLYVLKIKKA